MSATATSSVRSWLITIGLLVAEVLVLGWLPMLAHDAGRPESPGSGRVVLLGFSGTTWAQVTPTGMPHLFGLAGTGGLASLSVRTVAPVTCASDAWLTISAGRRATADCAGPHVHTTDNGATVTNWPRLVERQKTFGYDATPGLLGQTVTDAGGTICAIGPAAVLGAADRAGHVAHYWPRMPARLDPDCTVTLVASAARTPRVADAAVRSLTHMVTASNLPGGTDVYLAGIADATRRHTPPKAQAALHPLVHYQSGDDAPPRTTWLTSDATRWPGMVQLTDLTPTLLRAARIAVPADPVGAPVVDGSRRPGGNTATAHDIRSMVITDQRAHTGVLAGWLCFGFGALVTAATIVAVLRRNRRGGSRSVGRGAICAAGCFLCWIPLATYLTYLWPVVGWVPVGVQTAIATLVVAAIGAVLVIWQLGRRPHGGGLLAVTVVAGVTAGVLALDQATGAYLQHATPFGNNPVLGGRFYGMRNLTFGQFATCSTIVAAGSAYFLRRHGRAVSMRVVALIGLAAVMVDGLPWAGSDVGGMLALTPGMLLLVLLVGGVRVSWPRLVAVAVAGVLVFAGVATLDYHRPPDQRTHIGQFVARLMDGDAGPVLLRKVHDNLYAVGTPVLAIVLLLALVIIGVGVAAPGWSVRLLQRTRADGKSTSPVGAAAARLQVPLDRLQDAYTAWPPLQAAAWALVLTSVLAMLANDSGVILGLTVAMLLVPLLVVAASIAPSRERQRADDTGPPAPGSSTRTAAH